MEKIKAHSNVFVFVTTPLALPLHQCVAIRLVHATVTVMVLLQKRQNYSKNIFPFLKKLLLKFGISRFDTTLGGLIESDFILSSCSSKSFIAFVFDINILAKLLII